MTIRNILFLPIEQINNTVFKPCNLDAQNIIKEAESSEYLAHRFQLNGKNVVFRKAKITPTKVGQFVACWKRNDAGITVPFDLMDDFDCFLIYVETKNKNGFFVFSKPILLNNKIISGEKSSGKRGFRLYPPWNLGLNKQAERTQHWQNKCFFEMTLKSNLDFEYLDKLLVL